MELFFRTVGQYWEVALYGELESLALIQARQERLNLGDGTKNQREKIQLRNSYSSVIPDFFLLFYAAFTSLRSSIPPWTPSFTVS